MRALLEQCLARGPRPGVNATPVAGLSIFRVDELAGPLSAVYEPSIFMVVQGRKRARVGREDFVYDPEHYLVTSVPLPVVSEILEASPQRPFVSLAIDVELETVREIMSLAPDAFPPSSGEPPQRGLAACAVTPSIVQIAERLGGLFEHPRSAPVLGPLYLRELLFRVLEGPRGGFLRAVAMGRGQQRAIGDVLTSIHADCARPVAVGELAAMAGMSESVFYEAFKSVTASTPTQYIKRLRLQEAHRRLCLGLGNVSGVAHGVGYNSLSQFTREFTRVFGANPSAYLPR